MVDGRAPAVGDGGLHRLADCSAEALLGGGELLVLVDRLRVSEKTRERLAEGIETEAQAEALRAMRCQCGQGFLFSHPLPAEEATQLLLDEPTFR